MQVNSHTRLNVRVQHIVFIVLLVTIAGLLAWLSTSYSLQADWTRNGRHTLSDISVKVLDSMPEVINVTAFATNQEGMRSTIQELLDRYQRYKSNVVLKFIDPTTSPTEARKLGVQRDGELVIDYQGRNEHISELSEQEITNALQRLGRKESKLIVFLEGHGERSPNNFANFDYSEWATQLKNRGFKIESVNLSKTSRLPEKTSVLVLSSPEVNIVPGEVSILLDYIEKGGNLIWFIDPSQSLLGLEDIAKKFNLIVQPGIIIDLVSSQLFGKASVVSITQYGKHPITDGLSYSTFFPQACGLSVNPPAGWDYTALLTTNSQAWAETSSLSSGVVKFDEKTDIMGPLDVGIALSHPLPKTPEQQDAAEQRVVLLGDGDFLSNAFVGSSGNSDLAMKIINWTAHEDKFIEIPAKSASDLDFHLTSEAAIALGLIFLITLPLSLFGIGIVIWWRRRKA
jgi:ABC-type uncharacterized transport system involved in gliding motility auxiliary subunit